ncbi:enoyl-CoA hydratase/isomerase family protein [Nocardia sp. CNY236]|uniref:enoyl-CoA hydratase/isomerase family protein n=1 Tax=Nocardia sp. CNY236 TaxID=1169152 RepID=UPI001E6268CF|nr:enoyl-CoA hydratase-related protein [Nocardia sp. CNY236]
MAEVVLNRSQARNALSTHLAGRIAAACAELATDHSLRAVVLSSADPRAFCVGADLKERAAMRDRDFMAQRLVFRRMFDAVRELPVPTVAAVRGWALGGGMELMLCCDLVVAAEDAVVGVPEVTLGIVPGGGATQLLAKRIGYGKAADLLFTGRKVPATEAERLGLVDRLVPADDVRAQALELAERIAANSPVAVRNARNALRRSLDVDLAAGLDIEDSAWRAAVFSDDRAEGVAAFVERRPAQWPGH